MKSRHSLRAEYIKGKGIVVRDSSGDEVEVSYASTSDQRTCYAYTYQGFIGGWQYPHRRMPFSSLVDSINCGIVYENMSELPKSLKMTRRAMGHPTGGDNDERTRRACVRILKEIGKPTGGICEEVVKRLNQAIENGEYPQ